MDSCAGGSQGGKCHVAVEGGVPGLSRVQLFDELNHPAGSWSEVLRSKNHSGARPDHRRCGHERLEMVIRKWLLPAMRAGRTPLTIAALAQAPAEVWREISLGGDRCRDFS